MPQVTVNTKFYDYRQNNSGGGFDIDHDKGIGHYVIIEATDAADADRRAENIGVYFEGTYEGRDCECCGDRWYNTNGEGTEEPSLYGDSLDSALKEIKSLLYEDKYLFIHRIAGEIEKIHLERKPRVED
jgi:hypothetical protein